MASRLTMMAAADQPPARHLVSHPGDTQTAWEDPWSATLEALETTPHGAAVRESAPPAGQRITQEIDADPEEAERLRQARRDARTGKTFPRHSDTKSS
jgi:hypothetical protein